MAQAGAGGILVPRVAYVVVFSLAALACFASANRARLIEGAGEDTRRGLRWLLVTSGSWSAAHVGFLVAPTPALQYVFYVVGLVAGLSTLGPWLYFCSAYTERTLHRRPAVRRTALATFALIVLVKVTNPLHRVYFEAELVTVPFEHLAITHGLVHWLVTGFAYALAAIGYFMLFELFLKTDYDTRPLVALVVLTGLPVVLNVVSFATPALLEVAYEPLGVAAFAIGTLFVFAGRFQALQIAGNIDDPVIYLDSQDRVQDYNREAAELFPALAGTIDEPISAVVPDVADRIDGDDALLERTDDGEVRYYMLSTSPFSLGQSQIGRLLVIDDVTETERNRQKLERQNERLEAFASVISHDLRNPLHVAQARLDLEREERDSEHLATVASALDRIETLIEDVLTLARQGESIDETELVTLSSLVENCREMIDLSDGRLVVERDLRFVADASRTQQLIENLIRNALEHGGEDVTITVGPLDGGFYVADDGAGITESERDQVFDEGFSTSDDGTGLGLAIVSEIVSAHGWSISVTESESGGARFEITGVETATEP
ncbi:MAG: ATP-binding protein [Haloarculaceae archaeon]